MNININNIKGDLIFNEKKENNVRIFIVGIITLFLGHLTVKSIFLSPIVNIFGFFLLFLIIYYNFLNKLNIFAFIMIIYLGSHFQYALNQGGTFNLLAFALIMMLIISKLEKISTISISKGDITNNVFISIFFISNLLGVIFKNTMNTSDSILALLTFSSYLMVFWLVKGIYISVNKLRFFYTVSMVLFIWVVFTSINFRYALLNINSPFFGAVESYFGVTRVGSCLSGYAASSEYAMMVFFIILPLFLSSKTFDILRINPKLISLMLILPFIIFINTQMRATIILTLSVVFILLIYVLIVKVPVFNKKISFYFYTFSGVILLSILITFIDISFLLDRFTQIDYQNISFSSVFSGQDINRDYIFVDIMNRLQEESWILGYGWGNIISNQSSWFGDKFRFSFADPHSLYLSLLQIWGWIGSTAFILIILTTLKRLIQAYRRFQYNTDILLLPVFSFIIILSLFFIDQYKTNILSDPNYFMIFWIWLGFANAVVNTINFKYKDIK